MKLNDCHSVDLAPVNYAERLGWACAAFDEFVHTLDARRYALSAPFSMAAIKALTDEEMQVYYREIGLAQYYADLPRSARENMLFAELANLRKLGTVAAVESLCQYIFGANPIALTIRDNLAFDASGNITDKSLLNLYDAIVMVNKPVLDAYQLSRIFSNITRFGRVSQKLRGLVMRYETDGLNAYFGAGSLDTCYFYDNGWVDCTAPNMPTVVTVGIDSALPASARGLRLQNIYCMSIFTGGNSLRHLWAPKVYSDNLVPSSSDPSATAIPNTLYANVWIWDGTQVFDLSALPTAKFMLGKNNARPEIYTNAQIAVKSIQCACALEIQPGNDAFGTHEFSIPASLYTRFGDSVQWKAAHPLYPLLYGKVANIVY